jgi:hypothetical protein
VGRKNLLKKRMDALAETKARDTGQGHRPSIGLCWCLFSTEQASTWAKRSADNATTANNALNPRSHGSVFFSSKKLNIDTGKSDAVHHTQHALGQKKQNGSGALSAIALT